MKSFASELAQLTAAGRSRRLALPMGLDFSSNDYLGLSRHPALRQAAIEALDRGLEIGATGSRLLRGHGHAHAGLEEFAADYFGCDRALFFANGFQANYALITTLISRHDTVVFDGLCHASMRDGLHAVRCRSIKVPHNDLDAFAEALARPRPADSHLWILVESIYSMDGDRAPLAGLFDLAEAHDAILVVDEAHATGVAGPRGRGLSEGLPHHRLISLHTCGKALGVAGALVCAAGSVIDYLINAARPFIYSTAPMPLQAILVQRALEIVRDEPALRQALLDRIAVARAAFPSLAVNSQIIPIILGEDQAALAAAETLQAQGYDIRAIRPPTVPAGTARLRLSLTLGVTRDDIAGLAAALGPWLPA